VALSLSIIIVNWNVWDDLHECLVSIFSSSYSEEMEVILVDNASNDRSVVNTQIDFPRVKIIANSKNAGFSKANNQGLAIAKGEFVLFLNPDTVLAPNTLEKCIVAIRSDPGIGLLGCKIFYPDGRIQVECARNFPSLAALFWESFYLHMLFPKNRYFGKTMMTYWDHQDSRDVPCISGAFMLGPASLLKEIGGMDDSVFMFLDDIDLCYRIHEQGKRIYYLADVSILHKVGDSQKKYSAPLIGAIAEGLYIFFKKHHGALSASLCWFILLVQGAFRLPLSILLFLFTYLFPRLKPKLRKACNPVHHWYLLKWALASHRKRHRFGVTS
jgi:GT2 family glycosyltransferase